MPEEVTVWLLLIYKTTHLLVVENRLYPFWTSSQCLTLTLILLWRSCDDTKSRCTLRIQDSRITLNASALQFHWFWFLFWFEEGGSWECSSAKGSGWKTWDKSFLFVKTSNIYFAVLSRVSLYNIKNIHTSMSVLIYNKLNPLVCHLILENHCLTWRSMLPEPKTSHLIHRAW